MQTLGLVVVMVLACGGALTGCIPFSSYQSAKLLPAGKSEVAVAAGAIGFSEGVEEDEDSAMYPVGEVLVRSGVSDGVELGGRLSRVFEDSTNGVNQLLVDVKVKLIQDRLAFALPAGFSFTGDDIGWYQLHPTLLARAPLSTAADLELAAKGIVVFERDGLEDIGTSADLLLAATAGLRLRPGLASWWIQPELGASISPGDSGVMYQFGIAIGFTP